MNKQILIALLCGAASASTWSASAEQYVASVEKVTEQYKQERRQFFSTLNPNLQRFTPQQNQHYCLIVQHYIDGLYAAADENRQYLDKEYRQLRYADVVKQVTESKDMQLLTRYQVTCDFNQSKAG